MRSLILSIFWLSAALSFSEQMAHGAEPADPADKVWPIASRRGEIHAECAGNACRLLQGWIDLKQDPETGFFSRGGTWDYHDGAADHY